jgi:hypothetical protein
MAAIVRDAPPGIHWGFFSREDARMHLQTTYPEKMGDYKVWLEQRGKRVIIPDSPIPARIIKGLAKALNEPGGRRNRAVVESAWVRFMIDNEWVKVEIDNKKLTVTAYPQHRPIVRRTELTEGEYRASLGGWKVDRDVQAIVLGLDLPEIQQVQIRLANLIWKQ